MTLHPSRLGLARQAFDRALRENEARFGWLTDKHRADLAKSLGCEPGDVEAALVARERMEAWIKERREYEFPVGGAEW